MTELDGHVNTLYPIDHQNGVFHGINCGMGYISGATWRHGIHLRYRLSPKPPARGLAFLAANGVLVQPILGETVNFSGVRRRVEETFGLDRCWRKFVALRPVYQGGVGA